MSAILYKQIATEIRQADRILLCTDTSIDGDTMGSTLGMAHILRAAGKNITVFSPEPLPESLEFLPGVDAVIRNPEIIAAQNFDLIMIFDCSHGKTVQRLPASVFVGKQFVMFDHHASTKPYGTINILETEAASTGDVVYRFVKWAGYKIDQPAAQCLLTAICTDTNVFFTKNTTNACFSAAQELSALGAKIQPIVANTLNNKTAKTLQAWGLALRRLFRSEEFGMLATAITRQDLDEIGLDDINASDLSEFLNASLAGEDAILVMRETADGGIKGSIRSNEQDISLIAARYGGGGHINASGFYVPNSHLEERGAEWLIVKNIEKTEQNNLLTISNQ